MKECKAKRCSSFKINFGSKLSRTLSTANPFSSQLVIYRRFVTPLDVWYWRKRYPPASVWNDLGSHKPVRGGKRRADSTPFALVVRVRVRVSVIYHHDRIIIGVNGRCRLYENPDRFTQTREGTFYVSIRRLGAWQIVGILRVGMRTGSHSYIERELRFCGGHVGSVWTNYKLPSVA